MGRRKDCRLRPDEEDIDDNIARLAQLRYADEALSKALDAVIRASIPYERLGYVRFSDKLRNSALSLNDIRVKLAKHPNRPSTK